MLEINYQKCAGCLKCVSVCPFNVLNVENGKPEASGDGLCVKCLHCAAICPQNAIKLDDLEGILHAEIPVLPQNYAELIEWHLMTRRSYRNFKPEPVPKNILEHALKVAEWAPSAKNQHPAKWIVINDDIKIKKIMDHILDYVRETGISPEIARLHARGRNVVTGNAKTLLLAYAKTDAINPPVDSALALYTVELILQARGIGTCFGGYLTRMCNQVPALRDMLKLPEGFQFYGTLMMGYPENEQYIHIPNRHHKPEIQWL